MVHWPEFIDWAFKALLAGGLYLGLNRFDKLSSSVDAMKTSMQALNVNIAILVERTDNHSKTIEKHDERISKIEQKV